MERSSFIIVCLALLPFTVVTGENGDKLIRAFPENKEQVDALKSLEDAQDLEIDFWKNSRAAGHPVDMMVSADNFENVAKILKGNNVKFQTQLEDVQKAIESQNIPKGRYVSFHAKYHNLDEIHDELEYYNRISTNAKIIEIGKSYEGRIQKAIEFRGASKPNKPIFFLQCGIHAREWVAPASCMYIAHNMAANYGYDESITALLDKMDFIILPVVNVDGYAYTWRGKSKSYRLWRKTRSHNPGSRCIGTDPNRNWDHMWGFAGASSRPCAQTYKGSKPFSEKETENVKNYLTKLGGRVKGFIDTHAYSQMWFTPWGYSARDTRDHAEQMRVAKAAVDAIYNAGYHTRYSFGSSAALLYPAAGGSEDWTYGKLGIKYSFGTELRDTGRHGFLLPADQIIPTAREYFEGIKALVKAMRV